MNNLTRISFVWELHQQGISNTRISKHVGKHRETVGLWLKSIKQIGLELFLHQYECAKKGSRPGRQINPLVKHWIWDIRSREYDCCGQKIRYFLQKEKAITVSVPKIYEILKEKYEIKSKWKKNQPRGPIPKASSPREVIQIDTIDFGDIFAFTGIDIYSREADILIAPELTSEYGKSFLDQAMGRRFDKFVDLIQADGGPEFKDKFKSKVNTYCNRFRIARPYRKNEQSYIESFNRTVRKECLGWIKYKKHQLKQCQTMIESFLQRYHYHRPHMGLDMKPPLENKGA